MGRVCEKWDACVNQMDVVGQTVTGPQLDLTA